MSWLRPLVLGISILVWEPGPAPAGQPRKLPGHGTSAVTALALAPDGKLLVSAGGDHRLRIWEMATGKELVNLAANNVLALAFSPDGKTFAAGKPGEVVLYDAKGKETLRLKGTGGRAIAFSPDGLTLATGGYDGVIRLWSVPQGQELRQFKLPGSRITSLAYSPDGKQLLSGGTTLAVYAGNNYISTGQADLLRLWDVAGKNPVRELPTRGSRVALAPTGKLAAGGGLVPEVWTTRRGTSHSGSDRIAVVDLTTGQEILGVKLRGAAVAFDPKGKFLATAWGNSPGEHLDGFGLMFGGGPRWDPRTRLWDVASGKEVLRLPVDDAAVVVFSPDGKHLITGAQTGAILVWDIEEEKRHPTPDPRETVTVPPVEDKLLHLLHTEYEALLKREKQPDLLRRAAVLFHQKNPNDALALLRPLRSPASIPLLLRYWAENKSWSGQNFLDALVILTGQDLAAAPWNLTGGDLNGPPRKSIENVVKSWWLPHKDKLSTDLGTMTAEQKRIVAYQLLGTSSFRREKTDPVTTVWNQYQVALKPEADDWRSWWLEDLHRDMIPFLLESTGYTDKPPLVRREPFEINFRAIPLLGALRKAGQAPLLHKMAADGRQTSATRLTCLLALYQAGEPFPTSALLTLLAKEKRLTIRIAGILALEYGKPADTVPALVKFLDDPNRHIRAAALEALRASRPIQALPGLKKRLAEGLPGRDAEVQAALTLLGEIGSRDAQAILAAFLRRCLEEPGMGDSLWSGLTAFEQATGQRWVHPPNWSGADIRQGAQRALAWWLNQQKAS